MGNWGANIFLRATCWRLCFCIFSKVGLGISFQVSIAFPYFRIVTARLVYNPTQTDTILSTCLNNPFQPCYRLRFPDHLFTITSRILYRLSTSTKSIGPCSSLNTFGGGIST